MPRRDQPDLFNSPAELAALARGVPPNVKFGTSTWTYDGWAGDVYHRSYRGAQPAQRFNQDRRWGNLSGLRNPDFLNAELFKQEVLAPYARVFRDHAACFVFEFQAMRGKDLPDPDRWAEELDGFLGRLPRDFRYAVELRNADLLHPLHGAVLARHRVAHVFNSWNEMPPIGAQLELPWVFPADFTIARALLRPGRAYADAVKLFEPYDRVREPIPELRQDLVRL